MQLTTNRLIIIPCTKSVLKSISRKEDFKAGPHINTYIENLTEDASLLGWGVWLVTNRDSNIIIGDIGFKGKPDSDNTVEIGYGIISSAQNKGYATEAVTEIIKWAFTFENVTKIVAECHDENLASIKVLEKLHMKMTGSEKKMLKWELEK